MSTFQIIVLGIFTTLILVGVGIFAALGGLTGSSGVGKVVIWGTLEQRTMQNLIEMLRRQDKTLDAVTYVEKTSATYQRDLLNAMASGAAPDLFIVSLDDIYAFSDKIIPIPYSAVSESSFLNSFVDEGQLLLTPAGALALPLTIDPLVMYWNRDLFASAGVAVPPKTWNDFFTLAPKITSLDAGSQVKKSAVALGEWRNVAHAKEILTALFVQAGDPVVVRNSSGTPVSSLGFMPTGATTNPAESVLRFYTEFANPSKTSYSWNRALPKSTDAFVAGDLAVYFGFASEYSNITSRNPNLHFSVALLPQIEGSSIHATFGRMTGLSIPRSATNPSGALLVAQKFTGTSAISVLAEGGGLPPVRRDVTVQTNNNAAASVFVQSALIAQGLLDPSPSQSNSVFQTMIESVVSGQSTPASAVKDATQELQQLLSE